MKSVSIYKLTDGSGIDLDSLAAERPNDSEQRSMFFAYVDDEQRVIEVECLAKDITLEVVSLPIAAQKAIYRNAVLHLKRPGDQLLISGRHERRGARVIRLASDAAKVIKLLVTH